MNTTSYRALVSDHRIGPVHISLYVALIEESDLSNMETTIKFKRQDLMKKAKICARSTYNKRMHELAAFGYIDYLPSRYKNHKSQATILVKQSIKQLTKDPKIRHY